MKLSELIREELRISAETGTDLAKAITARLHECVKPLEWVEDGWWRYFARPSPQYLPNVAFWVMHNNDKWRFASTGEYFPTPEAAKAAAQAHYAAQIIGGLEL
jgi:hypothetical protein